MPPPGRQNGAISMRLSGVKALSLAACLWAASCGPVVGSPGEQRVGPDTRSTGTSLSSEAPSTALATDPPVVEAAGTSPAGELTPPTDTPPSPTPVPAVRQLTFGGCCVGPVFTPDGGYLLFIDKPSPDQPAGLWSVPAAGGSPEFFSDRLGVFSDDLQFRAFSLDGRTLVESLETGERWEIPSGGRGVSLSPGGIRAAWTAGQTGPPFDTAFREVWVSRIDGSDARQVFGAVRGGFAGWLDDDRLLVSGLASDDSGDQAYWALTLVTNGEPALIELGRGGRLREAMISPGGRWVAYLVTFSEESQNNGLWVADSFTGEARRLDAFGGYRWRDAERLLIVPLDMTAPAHRLLQLQAATGELEAVTDPALTPFRIANGDWTVSPGGSQVAFVSAADGNIWILDLPAE